MDGAEIMRKIRDGLEVQRLKFEHLMYGHFTKEFQLISNM